MSTRILLAAALLVGVPACSENNENAGNVINADVNQGRSAGQVVAAQATGELVPNDALTRIGQAAGIARALNQGEIDTSAFAVQVVQNPDVAAFANDMIIMHSEANAALEDVIRGFGVGFIPSNAQATLQTEAANDIALLRSTPPSDIDVVYMEVQIQMHAEAQVVLDQLQDIIGNNALGDYLHTARVMVNQHLARASTILASLINGSRG